MLIRRFFYILAITTFSYWIGSIVHELTHWLLGKYFHSCPDLHCKYLLPRSVDHHNLSNVSDLTIQLFGASPLIWWIPAAFLLGTLFSNFNYISLCALFIFVFAAGIFSRADRLAIVDPQKYRNEDIEDFSDGSGYVAVVESIIESTRE